MDYDWRPISEFPDYMINKEGDVRRIKTGYFISPSFSGCCLFVQLSKNGKHYNRAIRPLLRKAFPEQGA